MLVKLLSALLSAITLSAVYTWLQIGKTGYSMESMLLMGSVMLFFFYIVFGIPLTLLADQCVYRCIKKRRYIAEQLLRIGLYFSFGVGFGLLFLLFRNLTFTSSSLQLMIQFGVAGVVFAIYQILIGPLIRAL